MVVEGYETVIKICLRCGSPDVNQDGIYCDACAALAADNPRYYF